MTRWIMASLAAGVVTCGTMAALASEPFEENVFYYGELHAHSGLSLDGGSTDLGNCPPGGCGDLAAYFSIARDDAGLDFAALTDHVNDDNAMDPANWPTVVQLTRDAHDPAGGFVSILGSEILVERTDGMALGHKNLLFFGDDASFDAIDIEDVAAAGYPDECEDLWATLHDMDEAWGPMLAIPHHPASILPMPTRWWCHDAALSPVVEIYSTHGNGRALEEVAPYDPLLFGYADESTVNWALLPSGYGLTLGIIGGTDFHDTQPGMVCHQPLINTDQVYGGSLTGVYLDRHTALERSTIYGALRSRHTYATSGPKIPVMLSLVDDDGSTLGTMGDAVAPVPEHPTTLRLTLPPSATEYVHDVELFLYDNTTRAMAQVAAGRYEWTVPADEPEGWFAYAVLTISVDRWWEDLGVTCDDGGEDGTEKIWTSPIWVIALDTSDDDGDGMAEADGDCDDADPAIHPGAEETANGLDDDCDGDVDEDTANWDGDGDGFTTAHGDCDDGDPDVFPGAENRCDGVPDNDCDGVEDGDEIDDDGDGYTECDGDCDDTRDAVHPLAAEECDGIADNDCDGIDDPRDADGDGDGITACEGDCDDADPAIHPGATDVDNGIDDDCDGEVDEDVEAPTCACSSGGSGTTAPWIAAVAVLATLGRRRRSTRP